MIDSTTMKRLVIMKQIFSHGQEHRQKHTQMSNMLACHHYDLSIEMLLLIIGTNLHATLSKDMKFWDLWNEINIKFKAKFNADLPLKHEIQPLRDARNSIQHSGTVPSDSDVERFEGYTRTFLDDTIKKVFSIDFEEIKLSELINELTLKGYLNSVENLIAQDDFTGAIEKLSVAFAIGRNKSIKNIYESSWSRILKPFAFREIEAKLGYTVAKELKESFEKTEEMLNMLALNIDYKNYVNFKKKSFIVEEIWSRNASGDISSDWITIKSNDVVRTKEDAEFCYNFVMNSFITWEL